MEIPADQIAEACTALAIGQPLAHQSVSIAKMLSIFYFEALEPPEPAPGWSESARVTWRNLRASPVRGFLLTDGMGMGKTYQALTTVVLLRFGGTPPGGRPWLPGEKALIVLNSALIAGWREQLQRHYSSLVDVERDTFLYHGMTRLARLRASGAPIVFTTYETLRADQTDDVFREPWRILVLDEVHKARNGRRAGQPGSGVWRTLRKFPDDIARLGLTGTPICNNPMELCSIAQVVWKGHPMLGAEEYWAEYRTRFDASLVGLLRATVLLRRTIESEGIQLPPRTDRLHPVWLTAEERRAYLDGHQRTRAAYQDFVQANVGHQPPWKRKQARDRYSACVNGLGLLTCLPPEPRQPSSKEELTLHITQQTLAAGPDARVLIVSRFVKVLTRLRTLIRDSLPDARPAIFDGSLDWGARGQLLNQFRALEVNVILLSTMAGNEGVDFSCCQTMVLVDSASAPNPMTHEDQVAARVYRIGQRLPTTIHKLVAVGTIDDAFTNELHPQKRANAAALLDADLGQEDQDQEDQDDTPPASVFQDVSSTFDLLERASQFLSGLPDDG